MKIVKLFKRHILALVAIAVLLIIQANAELALPNYMSEIVDVGIQQGGIASSVPQTIRASALEDLELFMDEDAQALVEAAYAPADAEGIRAFHGSDAEAAAEGELASAMSLPETAVLALEQGLDASTLGGEAQAGTITLETVRAGVAAGRISGEQLVEAAERMGDALFCCERCSRGRATTVH